GDSLPSAADHRRLSEGIAGALTHGRAWCRPDAPVTGTRHLLPSPQARGSCGVHQPGTPPAWLLSHTRHAPFNGEGPHAGTDKGVLVARRQDAFLFLATVTEKPHEQTQTGRGGKRHGRRAHAGRVAAAGAGPL